MRSVPVKKGERLCDTTAPLFSYLQPESNGEPITPLSHHPLRLCFWPGSQCDIDFNRIPIAQDGQGHAVAGAGVALQIDQQIVGCH